MTHRIQSKTYKILASFFRRAFPELGSHLAAAAARCAEREHALTDRAGNVYLIADDGRTLRVPEETNDVR